ncbi:Yra2p CYBJADRAFT_175540 [Cyberlindnera jadinii NRRL Y-1542]|uniref:RRM domain-containing protein n=1 Tax=Cyberlindnera jadinii (strain ATCC 18201 / CBS 1600 / BCRC 20928 / JCM 3617 / NBRC 0987 / NRRL Y-1542) TaxID=983966 RepID=A0A1E4RUR7_CYBJN|nr:hypothetical protein CYBJADRAFT_175540 [Cyberlindnera jadinii NRRL Y-1542]ODV71024.1 hypothetical protein CYBJADRAFT_175540 [Cyberlindnera jadinii NRRL Y-1542]
MADAFEKSLDEIIGDSRDHSRRQRSERPRQRQDRRDRRDVDLERGPRRGGSNSYREREYKPRETKLQRLSGGEPYIKISNLYYELTQQDVEELLERIGKTRFVLVEFARDGRSSGVAYASYENPDDNITAVNKFDGKKAANQIIDVELIKPLVIGGFNRSRERHNPRSRRPRPKKATAEDLDKELEQYMDNKPFPATTE